MDFSFPKIHSFPPFFTRQLHEETWRKQRELWIELILEFCCKERIFEIDLKNETILQSRLFYNSSIDRKIDFDFLNELIAEMVKTERASWYKKEKALIYWRKPGEWAQNIYNFVDRIGGIGSIYTIYDLIEGEESVKEDFHNLPENLMKLVIVELEKMGKAQHFTDSTTTTNAATISFKESGLKFF